MRTTPHLTQNSLHHPSPPPRPRSIPVAANIASVTSISSIITMLRRRLICTPRVGPQTLAAALRSAPYPVLGAAGVMTAAQRAQSASSVPVATVRVPHPFEQFAFSENAAYLESVQEAFRSDPDSVPRDWWPVLEKLEVVGPLKADTSLLPEAPPRPTPRIAKGSSRGAFFSASPLTSAASNATSSHQDVLKLAWMCQAYELKGHLVGDLDPLGMYAADLDKSIPPELTWEFYGFTQADLKSKSFNVSISPSSPGLFVDGSEPMTLQQIYDTLRVIYTGKIAFEFAHISSETERNWLRAEIQRTLPANDPVPFEPVLADVIAAERFENLLHTKFQSHKRFGLDGGESLIPGMRAMLCEHLRLNKAASNPVEPRAVIGMAHRGRLNVLHNVCGKPMENILAEFEGRVPAGHTNNRGDVKYHMGYDGTFTSARGHGAVRVQLVPNPSHLECVNPVMMGMCRALIDDSIATQTTGYTPEAAQTAVLPIVIHGDAAFAGQGVCYEHVAMSDLDGYTVGGSFHIVINNQVGFTTNPVQSRSQAYCSDLGKLVSAPVIHVNGDHPEQVVRAMEIAMRFRYLFHRDVVVDVVCYRRYGHNEGDQPRYTQPLMYRKIDSHDTVLRQYGNSLKASGRLSDESLKAQVAKKDEAYRTAFAVVGGGGSWVKKAWTEPTSVFVPPSEGSPAMPSAAAAIDQIIADDASKLLGVPSAASGFTAHPTVAKVLAKRLANFQAGKGLEWAAAEQLAFATILNAGHSVRLAGQDVERGTFAQRHYVLHDYKTDATYCSLAALAEGLPKNPADGKKPTFTVCNSLLSEFAAAGFEFGYSFARPTDLVMWEAQFGDFANGAQPIWDQFLSSCEAKWGQLDNLVVSLPHGYDGQGPEHSSARIERFLQLSDTCESVPKDFPINHPAASEHRIRESNIQVCFPSTPASYFHLLRRQVLRPAGLYKPLINFFSKAYLRDPNTSTVDDLKTGQFQPVLDDPRWTGKNLRAVRKIVVCSGQIFHDINLAKEFSGTAAGSESVAFIRLEQLAPFPWEEVVHALKPYVAANPAVRIAFAQQEPRNMGPFPFVRRRLSGAMKLAGAPGTTALEYVGRASAASPATGFQFMHDAEVSAILNNILS